MGLRGLTAQLSEVRELRSTALKWKTLMAGWLATEDASLGINNEELGQVNKNLKEFFTLWRDSRYWLSMGVETALVPGLLPGSQHHSGRRKLQLQGLSESQGFGEGC